MSRLNLWCSNLIYIYIYIYIFKLECNTAVIGLYWCNAGIYVRVKDVL